MIRRNFSSRLGVVFAIALAVWLGSSAPAVAAGGSGSADFGGGGGGGGGFGGEAGGGSGSGGGHVPAGVWIVLLIAVLVVLFGGAVFTWVRVLPRRRRVHRREGEVRAAAAIAAQDDPTFATGRVLACASTLWLCGWTSSRRGTRGTGAGSSSL
jgi:hypothetical protein